MDNMNIDSSNKYIEANRFGALRELEAAKIFIQRGYTVSVPTMSARYDFIAEKYPVILRVQVKNLKLKKPRSENKLSHDIWQINAYSTVYGEKRPYTIKDCNVIVGICLETGAFAIVPIDKISGKISCKLSEHEKNKVRNYLNSYVALDN